MAAIESKLWYLEQINLLKNLSEDEMQDIKNHSTMKVMNKEQFIYFPEEPSKLLYFLKKGRVKIGTYSKEGKEILKSILYPGEIFGEMGVVGEERRRDFAIALDNETLVCFMTVLDFMNIMGSSPVLSFELTKSIGEKFRKMERKLESVIFNDARTRIINVIKSMARDYGNPIGTEVLIKHNLTHHDIANLTATSRQTVTSLLNELKSQDLIYMERNKILIHDINRLV